MVKKTVFYGGQFNPIHIAHALVASEVYHQIQPDTFYFMPSYMSPLKQHDSMISHVHRVRMIAHTIDMLGFGRLYLEEIERKGQSYTIDTMRAYQLKHPDEQLYFVIGTDQYEQLHRWQDIEVLKEIVTFIVVNRGTTQQHVDETMVSITIPRMDISSTQIRERIQTGQNIKALVPRNVERYILEECLYEN